MQAAIGDRITEEITTRIDVEEITKEALTALAGQDFVPSRAGEVLPSLAVPLSNAIENFVPCARRPGRDLEGVRGSMGLDDARGP